MNPSLSYSRCAACIVVEEQRTTAPNPRDLARSMGRYILTLNPNRAVRQALAEMD